MRCIQIFTETCWSHGILRIFGPLEENLAVLEGQGIFSLIGQAKQPITHLETNHCSMQLFTRKSQEAPIMAFSFGISPGHIARTSSRNKMKNFRFEAPGLAPWRFTLPYCKPRRSGYD